MRVVDSCGWLEYFKGGVLGEAYKEHILASDVLVPTVVMYEVYKALRRQVSAEAAEAAVADLESVEVIELDGAVALLAADVGLAHGLAMADAMVYATAIQYQAELVTSDADLAGLPGVTFLEKPT